MSMKLEDFIPGVQQQGLNSAKDGTLSGVYTFSGANTHSGAETHSGVETHSGAETHSGDEVFSGNVQVTGSLAQKAKVISGSGATVTLTAAQSGSVCLFDRAAGIVFTLPAPSAGLYFDFLVLTTITSNAAKVITDAGTTLLIGQLMNIDTDTSNAVAAWTADGSTHIAISSNGTTTGGLKGSYYRLTCVSSTLWLVTGQIQGSSTVATPFATS